MDSPAVLGDRDATSTGSASTWPPPWRSSWRRVRPDHPFFELVQQTRPSPGQVDRRAVGRRPRLALPDSSRRPGRNGTTGYRDGLRTFWLADARPSPRRAPHRRIRGPVRDHAIPGRTTGAHGPINFVAAHDGSRSPTPRHTTSNTIWPTVRTTVTASDGSRSFNHGIEGPTDDPVIRRPPPRRSGQPDGTCCRRPGSR